MPPAIYHIDAFTDTPFAGNPAAVCLLGNARPGDAWMQSLAGEMNLSETAFVQPMEPVGTYLLRWFTPAVEVELCGHATLAAAHLLWELDQAGQDEAIAFHTRFRGTLTCTREPDGAIAMDFPADPPHDAQPPEGLIEALGSPHVIHTARATYDWLIELDTEAEVREIEPNFSALAQFDCRAVVVTARAAPGRDYDIVSRVFAPRLRIAEDPVTGSVHCALGAYWQRRLDKTTVEAYQASSRGGRLRVHTGDDRAILMGRAVTVTRGELLTPITII